MNHILNPLTNRLIKINGESYKNLINLGYTKEDLIDYTNDPKPILPRTYLNVIKSD
jgi:hypothetical protein